MECCLVSCVVSLLYLKTSVVLVSCMYCVKTGGDILQILSCWTANGFSRMGRRRLDSQAAGLIAGKGGGVRGPCLTSLSPVPPPLFCKLCICTYMTCTLFRRSHRKPLPGTRVTPLLER